MMFVLDLASFRAVATLYLDIYQAFFENTYDTSQALIKNTFKWLLCVDEPLKSGEFLAAIAQNLSPAPSTLKRDELLDLCCNFLTLDEGLDMFRFAHPSVKEFLEGLQDYSSESSNALAAACCLVYLTSRAQTPSVRMFLADRYGFKDRGKPSIRSSTYSHAFGIYATRFAMSHCSNAGTFRSCDPLKGIIEVFLLSDGGRGSPLKLWFTSLSRFKIDFRLTSTLTFSHADGLVKDEKDPMNRSFAVVCAFGFLEIIDKRLETSMTTSTVEMGLLIALRAKNLQVARRILTPKGGVHPNPCLSLSDISIDSVLAGKTLLRADMYSPPMIESLLQLKDLDIEGLIRCIILMPDHDPAIILKVLHYDRSFRVSEELMTTAIEASTRNDIMAELASRVKLTDGLVLMTTAIEASTRNDIIAKLASRVKLTDELVLLAMSHPRHRLTLTRFLSKYHSCFEITCKLLNRMTRISIPFSETMDLIWEDSRSQEKADELRLDVIRHRHDLHRWIPWALLTRYDRDDIKGLLYFLGKDRRADHFGRASDEFLLKRATPLSLVPLRGTITIELSVYSRGHNHGARLLREVAAAAGYDGEKDSFYKRIMAWFTTRSAVTERTWAQTITADLDKKELSDLTELIIDVKNVAITPQWLEALVETQHPVFLDILLRHRTDFEITEDFLMAAFRNKKNALGMVCSTLKRAPGLRITERIMHAFICQSNRHKRRIMGTLLTWDPGAHISEGVFAAVSSRGLMIKLLKYHHDSKIGLAELGF